MSDITHWSVTAVGCNDAHQGYSEIPAFDAAYSFGEGVGDEGGMVGTPEEIGQEVTRFLKEITRADVDTMKYSGTRFWIRLVLEPRE